MSTRTAAAAWGKGDLPAGGRRAPARGPAPSRGPTRSPRPSSRSAPGGGHAGGGEPGERAAGTLRGRVAALDEAVGLGRGRLPDATLDAPAAVVARARDRAALSGEYTVVALAGATGSGKSSLLNALADARIAEPGVRRPTTGHPVAVIVPAKGAGAEHGADELLDWLDVRDRHVAGSRVLQESATGLVLLDLPDHDSVVTEHRTIAERLYERVDLLVWVVDPQKYADAALHARYLRGLRDHAGVVVLVLNQADRLAPAEQRAMVADLQRLATRGRAGRVAGARGQRLDGRRRHRAAGPAGPGRAATARGDGAGGRGRAAGCADAGGRVRVAAGRAAGGRRRRRAGPRVGVRGRRGRGRRRRAALDQAVGARRDRLAGDAVGRPAAPRPAAAPRPGARARAGGPGRPAALVPVGPGRGRAVRGPQRGALLRRRRDGRGTRPLGARRPVPRGRRGAWTTCWTGPSCASRWGTPGCRGRGVCWRSSSGCCSRWRRRGSSGSSCSPGSAGSSSRRRRHRCGGGSPRRRVLLLGGVLAGLLVAGLGWLLGVLAGRRRAAKARRQLGASVAQAVNDHVIGPVAAEMDALARCRAAASKAAA